MRLYLDTSALVKIHVEEEGSDLVRDAIREAEIVTTSAIAYVEARAAFSRRRHARDLSPREHRRIVADFEVDWQSYAIVPVTDGLLRRAAVAAERHRLRAYDAIHLASATQLGDAGGERVTLASWDVELDAAAAREGCLPLRRR